MSLSCYSVCRLANNIEEKHYFKLKKNLTGITISNYKSFKVKIVVNVTDVL